MRIDYSLIVLPIACIMAVTTGGTLKAQVRVQADTVARFQMKKVVGIGPMGHISIGLGTIDQSSPVEQKLSEPLKNKPVNLSMVKEYSYVLDNFQYFFQNYVRGKTSKEDFISLVERYGRWNLSDTVLLSRTPLRTSIYILTGLNEAGLPVYIADLNRNGDLSDDALLPLPFSLPADIASAVVEVDQDLVVNGKVTTIKRHVAFTAQSPRDPALALRFPEFSYCPFQFEQASYFLCYQSGKICVIPAIPNFDRVDPGKLVAPGQPIKIGSSLFYFAKPANGFEEVTLVGSAARSLASDNRVASARTVDKANDYSSVVAVQKGFTAAPLSGRNINHVTPAESIMISTKDLRGKYLFLDFWSTTCIPCIEEFKYLKKVYEIFDRSEIEILGIVDERAKGAAIKILSEEKAFWPTIKMNEKDTNTAGYRVYSYPRTFLIDPKGVIIDIDLRGEGLMGRMRTLLNK